jgi:TRAP-type mannitol/chloroaromatic compound transport system permease large subunit
MSITLSLLLVVALLLFAVPFWVAVGLGTVALLLGTGALPLSLLGETLFQGVDSFALIAIPLFVLTGDVMVNPSETRKVTSPGSSSPMTSGRQPTWRR